MSDRGVHEAHCNQGDYLGSCKYGDEDCPMKGTIPVLDRPCTLSVLWAGQLSYEEIGKMNSVEEALIFLNHEFAVRGNNYIAISMVMCEV
jgi:hypothetical protein